MKKTFYLMRHGQTLFNVKKKMQGFCDSPLTELGIRQAEIAAEYFNDIEIDHAYCSTSERCCDTLELVTKNSMPYTRLKGLKEMNFGLFEGENEYLAPSTHELYDNFFTAYQGECITQVRDRVAKTCIEIMEKEDHNVVLAVSHGMSCLAFLSNWQDIKEIREKGIPNCCIFKYEYEDKKPKLVEMISPDFSKLEVAPAL